MQDYARTVLDTTLAVRVFRYSTSYRPRRRQQLNPLPRHSHRVVPLVQALQHHRPAAVRFFVL